MNYFGNPWHTQSMIAKYVWFRLCMSGNSSDCSVGMLLTCPVQHETRVGYRWHLESRDDSGLLYKEFWVNWASSLVVWDGPLHNDMQLVIASL